MAPDANESPVPDPSPGVVPGDYDWRVHGSAGLDHVETEKLVLELLRRADGNDEMLRDNDVVRVASRLSDRLHRAINVHLNRYSIQRQQDVTQTFWSVLPEEARRAFHPDMVLDLGSGSENPLATVFTMVALGARRGLSVDLCERTDVERDHRFLAELTGSVLIDPRTVFLDTPITPETIWSNLSGVDLPQLAAGVLTPRSEQVVAFRQASADQLPIEDNVVGLALSNTFFEHVPDARAVVRELARITPAGGYHLHNIDCSDHRRYNLDVDALEFLAADEHELMVAGSNRLRPFEFRTLFEEEGFDVFHYDVRERATLTPEQKAKLAPRFAAMEPDQLAELQVMLGARRR